MRQPKTPTYRCPSCGGLHEKSFYTSSTTGKSSWIITGCPKFLPSPYTGDDPMVYLEEYNYG